MVRVLFIAVPLLLSMAVVAPFYLSRHKLGASDREGLRVISTHDMPSHLNVMQQFDKVLRSGVLYPRWLPDINRGYGIATMNFYPPGFYYLTSLINAIVGDWVDTLFVISVLGLAISGLAFYMLARLFYERLASIMAALFYMLLPYYALDLYWRGALPEFLGFTFMPLILYFAYLVGTRGRLQHYAGLGLFYGLHLLTHIPVALMMSYTLVFFAVLWSVKERNWRIGARLAGAMSIGLLLSAVYWLPAAMETRYAYEYTTGFFPYHESYITLLDPKGLFPEFFRMLNQIFVVGALLIVVSLVVLRVIHRNGDGGSADGEARARRWTPSSMWIVMAVATTFMATSFSIYISKLLPRIQVAVPAWRWLAIAGMFTSLLVAATVDRLRSSAGLRPRVLWACRIAFALIVALNLGMLVGLSIIRPLSNPTYHPPGGPGDVVESGLTPKDSTHPEELADTQLAVSQPATQLELSRWDPEDREVRIKADQPAMLRLKTYNFPGWTARLDGRTVPMLSDKDGIQQVEVPAGIHVVRATFENTPPRTTGTVLFGVGILLILGLSVAGHLRQSRIESEESRAGVTREKEPGSVVASTAKTRYRIPLKAVAVIGIVLIITAAIVVMTNRRSGSRSGRVQTGAPANKSGSGSLATGSETHLYLAGQDSILVAIDEQALNQVMTALSGRDTAAVDALVDSGRARRVANNTLVRVLEIGTGKTRIRIIEGEHAMTDGWVPERWLR
ncbi:MAG TPA: 6-pyruvoyl-tetrahydropterin synthase-related protein [Blastocatellia bacterium]|nr:6-pyruvoyl-tetrahydropterin synthase-related protein [Blastocatellia bacterium]